MSLLSDKEVLVPKFDQQIEVFRDRVANLQQRTESPLQQHLVAESLGELSTALEELQVAQEELQQQYEELEAAGQLVEVERQRYHDLFEFAPDGYLVTDANGMIWEANRAASTMLNISQQLLIGKPLINYIPQEKRRIFRSKLNQLRQIDSVLEWEISFSPRGLEPFDAALRVVAVRDHHDSLVAIRVCMRDITERKQAESVLRMHDQLEVRVQKRTAELATANEELRLEVTERQRAEQKIREQAALLDIATDAILVQCLEDEILLWNKGAERLYGWLAEEACGKYVSKLLHEDSPQLEDALQTVTLAGEWQGELDQVTKSGKQILVESRWTLVHDFGGKPKSILIVNTDITEKKQLEAQLLRTQRLESLGTLASGIAHDLNNVLAPILMSTQLLQMKISDSRSQLLLKTMESNVKRGAALIKQVLSFARGMEGERMIVQVGHLISEIDQIVKETFPKSIEFYTDIAPALWSVCGDVTQLDQVLMNLIINARDAMPDGGSLTICAENMFIDQNYARMNLEATVGFYVVITVADTGTGIPPEILERIFEPFFTTKEVSKGTGLGLSTVIGIIKSHDGFVKVDSTVGKGSQFKVYLPAVESSQTQQAENLGLPIGQGELILVVDDEAPIREITKTVLETHNYKVLTASDGIEAIALYAEHQDEINLVLTDMMMPDMDGLTTIRTLQKLNPQIKIIAVSGLASNRQVTETSGTRVKEFLSKPYTANELLQTLSEVINTQ